ncbi:hypothetical protein SAMN04488570_1495 [Nocardioides scoriae]|uniref:Uncharacterized protein n=1 Tax=Nocardioides scoriae TaxID=642780 RepID=A0A1H1QT68_9ACTN|nr:hypothetical protein [Nocardioides scoriae]SDS26513.1 hypothetical protein SAMN04488570_1495 [Nocardioides scoriae]
MRALDPQLVLPAHLGPLHPAEQGLVLVLAFGPFVLLGVTVWLSRRRDAAEPTDDVDQDAR